MINRFYITDKNNLDHNEYRGKIYGILYSMVLYMIMLIENNLATNPINKRSIGGIKLWIKNYLNI